MYDTPLTISFAYQFIETVQIYCHEIKTTNLYRILKEGTIKFIIAFMQLKPKIFAKLKAF